MMDRESSAKRLKKELTRLREQFAEWKLFQLQHEWTDQRLNAERKKLENIVNCLPNGLSIISYDYCVLFQNKWSLERFGNKRLKICYKEYMNKEGPCLNCVVRSAIEHNKAGEQNLLTKEGICYKLIAASMGEFDGHKAAVEIIIDVTEHRRAQEAIYQAQKRYADLVNDLNVGIFCTTPGEKGMILEANQALFSMFEAQSKEELNKHSVSDIYQDPKKRKIFSDKMLKFGFVKNEELELVTLKGKKFSASVTAVKKEDNNGESYFEGIIEDVTETKRLAQELEILNDQLQKSNKRFKHLALRDPLTGLYNHRFLKEFIEAELVRSRRFVFALSVIMIDVDYFKSINDVYGHHFGNLILKQLSVQLKSIVRRYDTIIRFGTEEFIIICSHADRLNAVALAKRILDTVNLYNFGNKKNIIKIKLSLAVASYPEDKITRGEDLIRRADQILNKVKEQGGSNVFSSLNFNVELPVSLEKKIESVDVQLLKKKVTRFARRANQVLIEQIYSFAKRIKLKDRYNSEQIEKTIYYATEIAKKLDLRTDEIDCVRNASMLHDLGKAGVDDNILLKESNLLPEELQKARRHPQMGVDILQPISFMNSVIPSILHHHERWDGKGYPHGLKEKEIPIGARIVGLTDVFEALVSDRPYRKAYPKDEALKIIKDGSGVEFDPDVVDSFFKILH